VGANWYVMNYSQDDGLSDLEGIYDIYDKSIATLLLSLLIGAGASYFQSGDKPTATTLAVVAIVQGLGIRNGSYSRFA
jgi:hypothetical protein